MNYSTTPLPKSEIELTVTIEPQEFEHFQKRVVAEAVTSSEIDGFRKGKAPAELVKKKTGESKILERASVLAVEDTYPKIIKELEEKDANFEPIGQPRVHVTKLVAGGELEYKARLSILPELTLPNYKKVAEDIFGEKHAAEAGEKEVEKALDWLRNSRAKEITVTRPAQKGDRVEVDFEAKVGGVTLENGSSKNHPLTIGEGKFMPGFEEEIVGMKTDETKTFSVTAPSDYAEAGLRGKTIDFSVTARLVQERIIPELTDDFAQGVGKFENIAGLRKSIRDGILAEKEEKERDRLRIKTAETLAEKTALELPELLIDRELAKMTAELKSGVERMRMGWNDYLANLKKSEEELKKEWRHDAERRVKIALVLRQIAKAEKIEPTQKEVQEATNHTIARLGIDGEELKKIDRETFLEYNTTIARNEKVFRFLLHE